MAENEAVTNLKAMTRAERSLSMPVLPTEGLDGEGGAASLSEKEKIAAEEFKLKMLGLNTSGLMVPKGIPSSQPKFSISDARKKLREKRKKKFGIFGIKDQEAEKNLSNRAFAMGPDDCLSEEEVDSAIITMLNTNMGIPTTKVTGASSGQSDPAKKIICFDGHSATLWLQNYFRIQQTDAIQRGQTVFMNRGIFFSLSQKHFSFHNRKDVLYRFALWDVSSDVCVNRVKDGTDCCLDPIGYSFELCSAACSLLNEFKKEGGKVDFDAARTSPSFYRLSLLSSRLRKAPSIELPDPEPEGESSSTQNLEENTEGDVQNPSDEIGPGIGREGRLTFFLNVYHALVIQAYCIWGIPTTLSARKAFPSRKYDINGKLFSIETIHNLLRGQKVGGFPLPLGFTFGSQEDGPKKKKSKKKKKKKKKRITLVGGACKRWSSASELAFPGEGDFLPNPEVHFLAFNGTNDSPPPRPYTLEEIKSFSLSGQDNSIQKISKEFLSSCVSVKSDVDELWLPSFFDVHSEDFTSGENEDHEDEDEDEDESVDIFEGQEEEMEKNRKERKRKARLVRSLQPLLEGKAKRLVDHYFSNLHVKFLPNEYDNPRFFEEE